MVSFWQERVCVERVLLDAIFHLPQRTWDRTFESAEIADSRVVFSNPAGQCDSLAKASAPCTTTLSPSAAGSNL